MRYSIIEIVPIKAGKKTHVRAYFRKKGKTDPVDMELFDDEKSKSGNTFDAIDRIVSIFNRNGYAFSGKVDVVNYYGKWSLFQWLRSLGRRLVFGKHQRYIVRDGGKDQQSKEKANLADDNKRPGSVREKK